MGALTKAIRGDSLNKPVRVDAVVLLSATGITTGKEEAGGSLIVRVRGGESVAARGGVDGRSMFVDANITIWGC